MKVECFLLFFLARLVCVCESRGDAFLGHVLVAFLVGTGAVL